MNTLSRRPDAGKKWRRTALPGLLSWATATACTGADPGAGKELALRVEDAQLVRGDFPRAGRRPRVTFVDFRRERVASGEASVSLAGRAEATAFAVHVGLEGDVGYWIVPVSVEDPAVAGELVWQSELAFSRELRSSRTSLLIQAVDADGRNGPIENVDVAVEAPSPAGALSVELEWDSLVDLDLYVTDPEGNTLSPKNVNTVEAAEPGQPAVPSAAYEQGGTIDLDSNANCVLDGEQREVARWSDDAPSGLYTISLDVASLCGQPRASYRITVRRDGRTEQQREGFVYESDQRETAAGGGVPLFVTEFSLE